MGKSNRIENQFDVAKFKVTRNLFIALTVLLSGLFTLNFLKGDLNAYATGVGALLSLVVLIILFKTRKYKIAAITAVFLAFGLNISNILIESNFHNFLDFFWIIIIVLYIFFTLGKIWGVINLYINVIGVVTIFAGEKLEWWSFIPKEFTDFSIVNFIINSFFAALIFCYIILQMVKQTRLAEEKYVSANEELFERNEEKTVMLKEIHHRVKNNLQVITSLLRLQSKEQDDPQVAKHFQESINRISAMAMIHEKMYQSDSLNRIDLKTYLESLAKDLIGSYSDGVRVNIDIQSDTWEVDPKHLVPLALIFNELVSNSIEHAFKDMSEGNLTVEAKRNDDGLSITYYDNGRWTDPGKNNSFGLELIETFTEQLDGTYKRDTSNGTLYVFEFALE